MEINKSLKQDADILYEIIEEVTGVTKIQINSRIRKRFIVTARMMMSEALRRNSKYKLCQIGSAICNIDHSTVLYYKKTLNDLMDNDYNLRREFVLVDSKFKQMKVGGMPLAKRLEFMIKERDNINKEIRKIKKKIAICI